MLLSVTVWTILKSVYNIYFHPLARFPGPKLAAASIWWETYVDVVKGELSLTLIDLHAKYGARCHVTDASVQELTALVQVTS